MSKIEHIDKQIYNMYLNLKSSGIQPKYLYIGQDEYDELRDTLYNNMEGCYDVCDESYMGLDLIRVYKWSHLMVV